MGDVDYRCHRIRFTRSPRLWFAYVYPPSGLRAMDEVVTATLAEGFDEALRRARRMIDTLDLQGASGEQVRGSTAWTGAERSREL